MDASRKVLIITYYWPPSGGVGVQRWMNFAIQLKKRGWEPWILTPENPQFEIKDERLLEKVKDIPVVKLPIWEPFDLFHKLTGNKDRKNVQQGLVLEKSKKSIKDKIMIWIRGNLLIPDPRVFWVRPAVKGAIELIKSEEIDTIITTGPPHSIHLIGRKVKRKLGIKWLADFRDPWSKWDVLQQLSVTRPILNLHKKIERSVIREADIVSAATKRLASSLNEKAIPLYNGMNRAEKKFPRYNSDYFTIGYYGLMNDLRDPTSFFQLLNSLCNEIEGFDEKLQIRIGGITSQKIKGQLNQLEKLNGKIKYLGYLPYEKIQEEYSKCNILLLLQNKTYNSELLLPLKIFEYIASNRKILALGNPKNEVGDLINNTSLGIVSDYEDYSRIKEFVKSAFVNPELPDTTEMTKLLNAYSYEFLVNQVIEVLEKND